MLLKNYTKEISRPECNPSFQSVHCIAHLSEDIKEVLPYLNTVLGGFSYTKEPPSVTFKAQGKLITIHPRKIAINALKDEAAADKILEWLKGEINGAWEKRAEIEPEYEAAPKPKVMEILRLLPKTNCLECGQVTCMVFAAQVAEGAKGAEDCPSLDEQNRQRNLFGLNDKNTLWARARLRMSSMRSPLCLMLRRAATGHWPISIRPSLNCALP